MDREPSPKPGPAAVEVDDREVIDYIARVQTVDLDQLLDESLGEQFGERFRAYRREFKRTLNYDHYDEVPPFPLTVGLELVNRCNLSCIMCYTINHSAPKESLTLETIERIVSEAKQHDLPAMQVGLGSEVLIYKGIRDVLSAAANADIMDVFLFTNGVLLNEDISRYIVELGVARVYVSLDAATPDTYKAIRGKNELERIEKNLLTLLRIREEHGARLPIVRVSFCVQEENVHERQAFLEKWNGVVDHIDFQVMTDFSQVDALGQTGATDAPRFFHEELVEKPYCPSPFQRLDVWSNGEVTPCCTFYGKNLVLGNVETDTLEEIWKGEKLEALRDEFRRGEVNANCRMCLAGRDVDSFARE